MFEIKRKKEDVQEKKRDHFDKDKNLSHVSELAKKLKDAPFNIKIHEEHVTLSLQPDSSAVMKSQATPLTFHSNHEDFKKAFSCVCSGFWKIYHDNVQSFEGNYALRK